MASVVNDENQSYARVNHSKLNVTRKRSALGNIKINTANVNLKTKGGRNLRSQVLIKEASRAAKSKPLVLNPTEETITGKSSVFEDIDTLTSFSSRLLPANVQDIDANGKLTLCSNYSKDVFEYLRQLENNAPLEDDFMKIQKYVNPRMRNILIEWLIQVHHRFNLLIETLYLSVSVIDRYLQRKVICKEDFQLLGISALLVASKFEEMYYPEIRDLIHVTDNTYSRKQVIDMEIKILQTLEFCVGCPLPIHFLRRYSRAADSDIKAHYLAKYLMEVTLVESRLSCSSSSLIAASATFISNTLLNPNKFKWNAQMDYYTGYKKEDIMPFVYKLSYFLVNKTRKFEAVKTKFADRKNLKVSTLLEVSSPVVQSWAKFHHIF